MSVPLYMDHHVNKATPAIVGRTIFVRTDRHLYRIEDLDE